MRGHTFQIHGPIRVCEACGLVRHEARMDDPPPCDPTEMDARKARIHAGFLRKLAAEFPDHPWVKGKP